MIKFFKALLLTCSLFILGNGVASASELDYVYQDMNCSQLKADLLSASESKSMDGMSFSYTGALNCNISILHKNLAVKMFYMMFGEFALKSMDIVIGLTSFVTNENFTFYDKAKAEVSQVEPFKNVIAIMKGLAHLGCFFVLLFVSIFYGYYLLNSAHDGSVLGKSTNVFWTTTRLLATIFLCVPLTGFDDFTGIQVVVMIFATIGMLLANVVWFIMPVFEYLYSDDVLEIQEKNIVPNKMAVSSIVDSSIQMHICDIQARKGVYLYGLDLEEMTKENIEDKSFGQCIKANETVPLSSNDGKNIIIVPQAVYATKMCAAKSDKRLSVSCGNITVPVSADGSTLMSSFTGQQQTQLRKIAYDVIGRYCMDKNKVANNADELNYAKECSTIFEASNFSYVTRYGKQVIATYESAPTAESIISNVNSIKDGIYGTLSGVAADKVKHAVTSQMVSDKIAMSLIRGWMSSSSFMLDLGSEYDERAKVYNEIFSAVKVTTSPQISGIGNAGSSNGYDRSRLGDEILNNVLDIKEYSNQIVTSSNYTQEKRANESVMMNYLFPAIAMVQEFNGNRDPVSTRLDPNSCIEDFNQCTRTSLNPLINIMKVGSDLTSSSMVMAIVANVVESGASYLNGKFDMYSFAFLANLSGLIASLFTIHALFGIMITYLPAVIIFAFFVGNALGWFLLVCKKVIIAQLWMITHMVPNQSEGFAGKGAGGYKLLIDILLRPSFIVFGVFVSFIMMSVLVSILNVLFGIVLNTFVFFSSPGGIVEFITNYILHIVYLILLIMVLFRAGKAMYKVPNALSEWFEMKGDESGGMWSELTNKVQSFVMQDMKKIMYITG
jgi:conjugal transfer/type IV secretion protein DotA/TraY